LVYEQGGKFRPLGEARRGKEVENLTQNEAIPQASLPSPHKMEGNHFIIFAPSQRQLFYNLCQFLKGSSVKMVVIYWAYNSCISFKNNKI